MYQLVLNDHKNVTRLQEFMGTIKLWLRKCLEKTVVDYATFSIPNMSNALKLFSMILPVVDRSMIED